MNCIPCHSSKFLPGSLEPCTNKNRHFTGSWVKNTNTDQLLGLKLRGQASHLQHLHALHHSSIFLSVVKSPASSGDFSVLLPVSAVLLAVYWVANFAVPDIIYKNLQTGNEEQTQEEGSPINPDDPSMPNQADSSKRTKSSMTRKSSKW